MYAVVRSTAFGRIPSLAELKCVSGVTLYFSWRELEPEPGKYNFSLLDQAVGQALRSNLRVNLAVLPGRWTPAWAKEAGIPYMSWTHSDSYVEDGVARPAMAPVPWDARYLNAFSRFVSEFRGHLAARNFPIESVAITGPSNTNGLEMALVGTARDLDRAQFTPNAYIAAWNTMIDVFAAFPPDIKLTLALHDQVGPRRRADLTKEVAEYARRRLGKRYVPMLLAFESKSWFHSGNQYAGLLLQGDSAESGALQMIRIFSSTSMRAEFELAMRKGEHLRPQWLEVWVEDVQPGYLDCR